LTNLDELSLTKPTYHVILDGKVVAQLIKQEDESYFPHPDRDFEVPLTRSTIQARIVDELGVAVYSSSFEIWADEEDVTVYKQSTGKRIDAWKDTMHPNQGYFLIYPSDLSLVPECDWEQIGTSNFCIASLKGLWPPDVELLLENHSLWNPNLKSTSRGKSWAQNISVRVKHGPQVYLGQNFCFEITHDEDIEVTFV
jgi:hypothetical protein